MSETPTRLSVDHAFGEMVNDVAYREEAYALAESFAVSDWEALAANTSLPQSR